MKSREMISGGPRDLRVYMLAIAGLACVFSMLRTILIAVGVLP